MSKINLNENFQKALIYFSGTFGFLSALLGSMFALLFTVNGENNKKHCFITLMIIIGFYILQLVLLIIGSGVAIKPIVFNIFSWAEAIGFLVIGFVMLFSKNENKNNSAD